jgi:hypothetical protein
MLNSWKGKTERFVEWKRVLDSGKRVRREGRDYWPEWKRALAGEMRLLASREESPGQRVESPGQKGRECC